MADDDEDPFERARAAIRAGREARGIDPDAAEALDAELPTDPMERARVILERAAAARASKGPKADEREAQAREQLARLKGRGPTPSRGAGKDPSDDPDDTPPPAPGPKVRRL